MSHHCDCGDAQDQIYQYLDSELDEATASAVRDHLDDCNGCSDSFEFERRLKNVIRECLTEDVPEALEQKVKQLLREETA
ncbi:MAG TPA: mycothiol system anti-sigma-R factor [Acidimicrobiia bacterium]|nr:mycothiol system anti-sigma-R factor [Acidimicrobiia bacterium]